MLCIVESAINYPGWTASRLSSRFTSLEMNYLEGLDKDRSPNCPAALTFIIPTLRTGAVQKV